MLRPALFRIFGNALHSSGFSRPYVCHTKLGCLSESSTGSLLHTTPCISPLTRNELQVLLWEPAVWSPTGGMGPGRQLPEPELPVRPSRHFFLFHNEHDTCGNAKLVDQAVPQLSPDMVLMPPLVERGQMIHAGCWT